MKYIIQIKAEDDAETDWTPADEEERTSLRRAIMVAEDNPEQLGPDEIRIVDETGKEVWRPERTAENSVHRQKLWN